MNRLVIMIMGLVTLGVLGTAAQPASAQMYHVYRNCRVSPCVIGVANRWYAVPNNRRYQEGWRKATRGYRDSRAAWRIACRLHRSSRYNSPDIRSGRVNCASLGVGGGGGGGNRWVRPCGGRAYAGLIRRLYVPQDRRRYSACREWGRWRGSSYAGYRNLPSGHYWVYRAPYWYIYRYRR